VPGVAFLPHFDTFGHRWVDSAAERDDVVLLGVDERTAALREGEGGWRALGDGGVTVIAAGERRRFEAGQRIEGLTVPS
ncbi:MAG: hypothetical protein ACXWWX_09010, partial [Actinomycetota bacterium]